MGDTFPAFTCKDQEGKEVTQRDVMGYPCLLLFFPYAEHVESLNIAKALLPYLPDIDEFEALLIGISPDTSDTHRAMMLKHQLFFPMLTDKNRELAHQCQVGQGNTLQSALFLIDEEGTLLWIEKPAQAGGIAERVLDALEIHFG